MANSEAMACNLLIIDPIIVLYLPHRTLLQLELLKVGHGPGANTMLPELVTKHLLQNLPLLESTVNTFMPSTR